MMESGLPCPIDDSRPRLRFILKMAVERAHAMGLIREAGILPGMARLYLPESALHLTIAMAITGGFATDSPDPGFRDPLRAGDEP